MFLDRAEKNDQIELDRNVSSCTKRHIKRSSPDHGLGIESVFQTDFTTEPKKEGIMYLPGIYEKFSDKYPEVFKDYKALGIKCRAAGPIDQKHQDLIKLGIAIGANSRGGVMSHTRKALASGATPEEIMHTVLLSLTTTGFPNMIASMGWVDEVLQGEGAQKK